ncbi:hypothetical protein CTA1_12511 [Colletotrichum tanaceti]|uniref:Uncharacterized protein n=1 Tax=Colletotrichum tanaceti TaxID=1306861 RepID=A0A4U6XBB6_9PEZI|nr:hypothetical protein CTA1_12511 [Colletotrichum tanaceti]
MSGADETHTKGAKEDEQTRPDALGAPQDAPALVRQKVLGEQLDEGGEDEQAGREGVHGADEDQAERRVRAVEAVGGEADGLADRGGAAVGEGHHPRLQAALGPGDGGDARAEGEALKGLVEGDGDEEHDELVADGDAEGHADEDGVEEDADLEHHALQDVFLVLLRGGEDEGAVGVDARDGAALLVDALREPLVVGPRGGLRPRLRLLVRGRCRRRRWRRGREDRVVRDVLVGHVAGGLEDHLDDGDEEDAGEGDGAGHGRVVLDPEGAEARVAEEGEGGREEVDEGGGEEDAGAEVADGEEEGPRDADGGHGGGDERQGAGEEGDGEDDEEGADVERPACLDATRNEATASGLLRAEMMAEQPRTDRIQLTQPQRAERAGTEAAQRRGVWSSPPCTFMFRGWKPGGDGWC